MVKIYFGRLHIHCVISIIEDAITKRVYVFSVELRISRFNFKQAI